MKKVELELFFFTFFYAKHIHVLRLQFAKIVRTYYIAGAVPDDLCSRFSGSSLIITVGKTTAFELSTDIKRQEKLQPILVFDY